MKIVCLTLLLMSTLLPGFAIAEDFRVKWGLNEYNSKTGIFTQRYCAEGKSPQSVTLKLSAKVIKALLDAAREDAKSSKGSGDKRCFSSGPGTPLLTILAKKETTFVDLNLCESKSRFSKMFVEQVYKSKEVQGLDRPHCRGTVR